MASPEKARILVVDDDPAVQKLIIALLNRASMDALSALDANEAAQILRKPPLPDAIVLDLMMPGISGMEFLRQMRQKSVFDAIPVVILSAIVDPEQIREGLNSGADRYLTKPYLASNLVATLQDVLRTGRKQK
ncbi:MAG: response regulator [Aggregatilineales bacterium]